MDRVECEQRLAGAVCDDFRKTIPAISLTVAHHLCGVKVVDAEYSRGRLDNLADDFLGGVVDEIVDDRDSKTGDVDVAISNV